MHYRKNSMRIIVGKCPEISKKPKVSFMHKIAGNSLATINSSL